VLSAQKDERLGGLLNRLASELGKAKAYPALAHKLGRAFDHLLHAEEVFDVTRSLRHSRHGTAGEPTPNGSRRGPPQR
jgi:hypothetical protein